MVPLNLIINIYVDNYLSLSFNIILFEDIIWSELCPLGLINAWAKSLFVPKVWPEAIPIGLIIWLFDKIYICVFAKGLPIETIFSVFSLLP